MARTSEETSALGEACTVLAGILADGPVWAIDAIRQAEAVGVEKRTLKRAKSELGVESVKIGKPGDAAQGWKWQLPATPEGDQENPKGTKPEPLVPFADLGPLRDNDWCGRPVTGPCTRCQARTGRQDGEGSFRCSRCKLKEAS